MTEKNTVIRIEGDYLDRGRNTNTDNKAFVLAVSGKWGTGKSYFMPSFYFWRFMNVFCSINRQNRSIFMFSGDL